MDKMIRPRHDRSSFLKYYTAESAKKTLFETRLKWSSPKLFNDPFDNQLYLQFEEPTKSTAREISDEFLNIISSNEPIRDGQFGSRTDAVRMLQLIFSKNQHDFSLEEGEYIREGLMEGMENLKSKESMHSQIIHEILSDTSIFCVSETHNNILMWSHYADNHTGVAVEFHAQLEDSAFILAQPVRYMTKIPIITYEDIVARKLGPNQLFEMITLIKSKDWEYEREWRVVAAMRDKSKDYEILSFPPEEVAGVYFGCRTTDESKREIIEIVNDKYPDAKIYQARKHEREFSLVFDPV